MKKLGILIFLATTFLFTGCSQKLEEGILKVDNKYKEKNAKTKVYYVDNNYEKTREQLNKLVENLNNNKSGRKLKADCQKQKNNTLCS